MNQINTSHFRSPWGEIILGTFDGRLCLCDWLDRRNRESIDARLHRGLQAKALARSDALLYETTRQLQQYFSGLRQRFDIPLLTVGTPFQETVWKALQQLPYGHTCSYRQLSETIGKPGAVRAVAAANGANALSLLIPCHRVVGSDGSLTGYAGGLEAKAGLLAMESVALDQTGHA